MSLCQGKDSSDDDSVIGDPRDSVVTCRRVVTQGASSSGGFTASSDTIDKNLTGVCITDMEMAQSWAVLALLMQRRMQQDALVYFPLGGV